MCLWNNMKTLRGFVKYIYGWMYKFDWTHALTSYLFVATLNTATMTLFQYEHSTVLSSSSFEYFYLILRIT